MSSSWWLKVKCKLDQVGVGRVARYTSKIHLVLAIVWALLVIPTVWVWSDSVLFVNIASVWANVVAHLAGWSAARAERAVEKKC